MWSGRKSRRSTNTSDLEGLILKRVTSKPSLREGATSVRRQWVLFGGALVAISTYALGLFIVSAGVDTLGFLARQEWMEIAREDYTRMGFFIARWVWPPLYLSLVVVAALWVGRRVIRGALLHGLLIGAISAGFFHLIGLLFGPPRIWELVAYPLLGLAGGALGGLRGWSVRAGEEALYETSRDVSASRNPREIAAAIGKNLAGSEVGGVSIWEQDSEGGDEDEFSLMGSWSPRTEGQWIPKMRLDATRIPVLEQLENRTFVGLRVEDLPSPDSKFWEKEGVRSLLLISLSPSGGDSRALLVVASRKSRGFSRGATRAYLTVGGPAALALENVRLLDRARKTSRKAGMLSERQRLAREIHDTLAQGFTSIVMNLEAAEGALPEEVPEEGRTKWHLDQARFTARENLTEARRLVWDLRPESLDNASLTEALAQLTARWSDTAGIEASVNASGTPRPMPDEAEVTLMRMVQEALANVLKHAVASRVVVTLSYMNDLVALDVIDDGVGFDSNQALYETPEGGFGLRAMRQRVEQLGGSLTIESAPGQGTTLVAELPLTASNQGSASVKEAP